MIGRQFINFFLVLSWFSVWWPSEGRADMRIDAGSAAGPIEGAWAVTGTVTETGLSPCVLTTYIASSRRHLRPDNLTGDGEGGAVLASRTSGLVVQGSWGETFQSLTKKPMKGFFFIRARLSCKRKDEQLSLVSRNIVKADFASLSRSTSSLQTFARHLRRHIDRSG